MIKLGVSSCVLGAEVRFDGGHKRSGFVAKHLNKFFDLLPVCPEVGIGLGVPRPTIRLTESEQGVRLTDSRNILIDHTDKLTTFADKQFNLLQQLDGYIVAAKSPTCGMERVKVYAQSGELSHRKGTGIFVAHIQQQFPNLPIEEDGRLNDAGLRESFITRVFAHHDFRQKVLAEPSRAALVKFHSRYKFLVMAYNPLAYRQLGQLVSFSQETNLDTVLGQYLSKLMATLAKPTNRKKHTNALMHLQGFIKKQLAGEDKQELCEQIENYRLGYVPLLAPITLLQHHLKRFPNQYVQQQVYLQPYPKELGLQA